VTETSRTPRRSVDRARVSAMRMRGSESSSGRRGRVRSAPGSSAREASRCLPRASFVGPSLTRPSTCRRCRAPPGARPDLSSAPDSSGAVIPAYRKLGRRWLAGVGLAAVSPSH
jgi:hypothetical protein